MLDTKISLHFPRETRVQQVLDAIRQSVHAATGRDLVLFTPRDEFPGTGWGRQDVVTIDRENVPAREALRLCLEPNGATYIVRAGHLRIVPDTYRPLSVAEDPAMIAGHSLLALVLAAIGAVSAPLLFARPRPVA